MVGSVAAFKEANTDYAYACALRLGKMIVSACAEGQALRCTRSLLHIVNCSSFDVLECLSMHRKRKACVVEVAPLLAYISRAQYVLETVSHGNRPFLTWSVMSKI
ncbi:hypothetical protein KC362_g25 [Hortaea werneckii]|nr:hypothetical protein KC362_g25 [Hortaea werneckii]